MKLSGYFIDSFGAATIAAALEQNQTIQTLELNIKGCHDKSGNIAIALTNQTLRKLVLCNTNFELDAVAAIASALKTNRSLRVLKLEYTSLDDKGAIAISEALQTNATLRTLKIVSFTQESITQDTRFRVV